MTAAFVVIRKIMDLVNYAIVIVTITAAIRRSGGPYCWLQPVLSGVAAASEESLEFGVRKATLALISYMISFVS